MRTSNLGAGLIAAALSMLRPASVAATTKADYMTRFSGQRTNTEANMRRRQKRLLGARQFRKQMKAFNRAVVLARAHGEE